MKYSYLNDFKLYTIKDLQSILKISRSFAYRLMHSGEIKCVHIHRLLRITPWTLEAYMHSLTPQETELQRDTVKSYFSDSIHYYTIKEIEQAYDAYRAEMEYEDFMPMTFEEFKDEQEAEGYWRVDAYLLW